MIITQPSYRVLNNLIGGLGVGYFAGSWSEVGEFEGIAFATETAVNPSTYLSMGRYSSAATNSSSRGYVGGGFNDYVVPYKFSLIDGINFSDESMFVSAATLAVARYYLAGVNSTTRGYYGGGHTGPVVSKEIDGLVFATDTPNNPAAALTTVRFALAGSNSSTHGYFAGGAAAGSGPWLSDIDRLIFSTETTSLLSARLAVPRDGLAGFNSSTRGYYGGGGRDENLGTMTFYNEIDGIRFDTEAAINPTATLSLARVRLTGVNSTTSGYFSGGYRYPPSSGNIIEAFRFNTETVVVTGVTHVNTTISDLAGFQSGGAL